MSWKNSPHYNDNRRLLEIPVEEARGRIRDIINSNPIIAGTLGSRDGNLRQTLRKMTTVKTQIKERTAELYKNDIKFTANRFWTDFQTAVAKLITDFLIYENYQFYLQDKSVTNNHTLEKGEIWFLPAYFCLSDKYRGRVIAFFPNKEKDYHEKEFYCETADNQRHPCLTIDVAPDNRMFWVLVCSSSPHFGRNEPVTLQKNGSEHKQFIALDWKIEASRKMLDINDTQSERFGIEADELARIEARIMLK